MRTIHVLGYQVRSSVPIARTEISEEEPYTARLRWHRAYIPRYYSSTPIKYRVEMQEGLGGLTDTDWRPVARNVTRPDITVRDISPRKDYRFRIRAELENGEVSDPTPPIQYYRSHFPVKREPLADYKLVEYEAVFLNRPYFDHLTKYVPPRMPIVKPDMVVMDQESVELLWKPAIVAEAIKGVCNLTYTIEVRCPPSFEWRELVTGIHICSHTVTKLHPRIDYIFRIRAWNEYGCSETTLPVSLYRPHVRQDDDDDEEFEREWELKYGTQDPDPNMTRVPPKLPIDTPKIVTQSSDSIWFSWLSARIPAYATQTNINYVVEVKEPPSTAWRREATGLLDCQHVLEGLNPNQEYHIRVRAETEFGPSEPTMPIIIRGRGSRSSSRRSSVDRDEINLDGKLDVTYLENLMSGVPPRMPSTRPIAVNAEPDRLTLKWSSCRTPSYVRASNVTYIVEKREPPGHIWSVVSKDIKGTKFDVTGLNGDQDYMFRIRAKNEYGISEPTLPMTIYRDRDDYVPQRIRSRSGSRDSLFGSRARGRSSSIDYSGSKFEDMDRSSVDRIPCEPEYITTTYDTQYGVIGNKGKITLKVRAYPLPTVHWYFNDAKLEYGDQYNTFVTPTGDVILEIKKLGPDMAGQYKCYAENASGAANKVVTFELAEPPTVLEPLQDISMTEHGPVKFMCRVDGFPNASVKWTKDWRPIAGSTHCNVSSPSSETFMVEIPNVVDTDAGLYACTVENLAGKVVLTGRLTVEIGQMIIRGKYIEDLLDTLPATFDDVNIRSTPIEERYHILEEIGRGRFGIVRRVVEMSTGRTFAANYMSFRNKSQKNYFMSEFETLCTLSKTDGILKLYDAFETDRSLIFVTEFLTEPDLLEKVISDGNWTETNVALIIKKLLMLLSELEKLRVLHLDIKPGNIRMTGSDLSDIKLMGFGYSRRLLQDEDVTHNYGSVGYASPEQITNDVVSNASDLWSIGVLAYVLLSGNGPFQGSSEVEILSLMSECLWTFEGRGFDNFTKDARDFIGRLLVRDPKQRMSLSECLSHPWLSTQSDTKIDTEKLKQFYIAEKLQRELEKVYTTVQLQSFAKIIHGRKALYQPAVDIESGEIIFPDSDEFGNYLDEDSWYQWQLQYLDDPDSQIYPIQDEGFTVRECRHAGAPKFSKPKIKERSDRDDVDSGTGVLFRDKIQPTTFQPGENVTFSCTVITKKKNVTPVITWYRDEQLLSDDYRSDAEFNPETGVAKLTIVNTKDYDSAVYKCVARIKDGRVSCQARLYLGDIPSQPGRPMVMQTSGSEAFLTWNCPALVGNSYILGYRVDYRIGISGIGSEYTTWNIGPYVTEEFALINGLDPNTSYIFRISCHNKYGTSPFSWSSLETKTLGADASKVSVAADLLPVMQFSTFDKQQMILPAESRRPSLTIVDEAKMSEADPNETFTFSDTISKGSYGEYKSCINKTTNQQCVAKIMPYNEDNQSSVTAEFNLLHTLRQANLITVLDSYIHGDQIYVIHEYLSGMNVLEYLCLHKSYTEEKVATLVRQILDAVQFLQCHGIIHLNLQPSSVAMASQRRPHIKLRDFTLAQKINMDVGMMGAPAGYPDFTCPEVLKEEKVTFTADIWTIGALTFTMLSGVSPFGGNTLEETLSRVLFDRYSTKEMYDNVTKESVKFVCKLMARLPRNRPTVNKCLNSHWLNLNESMVTTRSSKHFKSERLCSFLSYYMGKRGNEDYKVAQVDIETLPKIVPAPKSDPILSDKIMNKLENNVPVVSLADVLHEEAAKIPDLPLLEKLVYKIERDTEIKKEADITDIEGEANAEVTSVKTEIGKDLEETVVEEDFVVEEALRSETEVKAKIVANEKDEVVKLDTERVKQSVGIGKVDTAVTGETEVIDEQAAEKEQTNDTDVVDKLDRTADKKQTVVEDLETAESNVVKKLIDNEESINEIKSEQAESIIASKTQDLKVSKPEDSKTVEAEKKVTNITAETEKLADDGSKIEKITDAEKVENEKQRGVIKTEEASVTTKSTEESIDKNKDGVLTQNADVSKAIPAEDQQIAPKVPEEKTDVPETDEVYVDALESIAPEVKPAEVNLKPEMKDAAEDLADDEFSEAPETNGEQEHLKGTDVALENKQVNEEDIKSVNEEKVSAMEQTNESIQVIEKLAETKAEEIKTAALKEIADGKTKPELLAVAEDKIDGNVSGKMVEETGIGAELLQSTTVDSNLETDVKTDVDYENKTEVVDKSKSSTESKSETLAEEKAKNESMTDVMDKATEIVSKKEDKKETSETTGEVTKVQTAIEDKTKVSTEALETSNEIKQDLSETVEKLVEKAIQEAVSAVATSEVQSNEVDKTEVKYDQQKDQQAKTDKLDATAVDKEQVVGQEEVTEALQVEKIDKQAKEGLSETKENASVVQTSDSSLAVSEVTSEMTEAIAKQSNVSTDSSSNIESKLNEGQLIQSEIERKETKDSVEQDKLTVSAVGEEQVDATIVGPEKSAITEKSSEETTVSESISKSEIGVSESCRTTKAAASETISKSETTVSESSESTEAAVSESISESKATASDRSVTSEQTVTESMSINDATVSESVSNSDSAVAESISESKSVVSETTSISESITTSESTVPEGIPTKESSLSDTISTQKSAVESAVSESISKQESTVSESISSQETAVSESISKQESAVPEQESAVSESISKQESTVSESISSQETAVSESISKQESAVPEQESAVSESISKQESDVSESISKQESAVSESISKQESDVSESISKQESSVSESIPKQESTVSESISTTESSVSESISTQESSVSESISTEESSVSESISTQDSSVSEGISTQESSVSESISKQESTVSESISTLESSVSESISTQESSVSESISTQESSVSESISKQESAVSESISTQESLSSDNISTQKSAVESAVSESILTTESVVSDKSSSSDSAASESKSTDESVVTDGISSSDTFASDNKSKGETAVSESCSKSESSVSESITVNESPNAESISRSESAVSQTNSQNESIVSDKISSSESDSSKNQSEVSQSIIQNELDVSNDKSKSQQNTESNVVGKEQDKLRESNEQTKDSNVIESSEMKDLDVTDSNETVSIMEVNKQLSAKQNIVENISDTKLISNTAESSLSENVVATEQATSEDLISKVEKSASVIESIEQTLEGGKLEVTEKKQTNVVVTENLVSADETTAVETTAVESSTLSKDKSVAVLEEKDNAGRVSSVTESSMVEVESSQEMSSSVTVSKEEISGSVSTSFSEESEITRITTVGRKETLISGSILTESSEEIMNVSSSMVEDTISEEAVASNLETAKVTKARETVREFMSNESDIEAMKKEILEDMEVTSADCGKYLLGSHEDLSSLKDKAFSKPDEDMIAKETSMNYLDDALMFC